jgi:cytochrome b6-f complex iron-sulfur subunit
MLVGFAVIVVFAVVALVTIPRNGRTVGHLSRETSRRDRGVASSSRARSSGPEVVARAARARADEARRAAEGSAVASRAGSPMPAAHEPVSNEGLGITRRQFMNRGLLGGVTLAVSAFGVASLGFLWPTGGGGFGGKIEMGSVADAESAFGNKEPFYNAVARAYLVPYPKADLGKAKKVAAYTAPIIAGMELGYVALYQKCPHLGCRVPWCQSSQWFECPCHGSKYNRVGEKRGGPAPRGMDRFPFTISGGTITVDTSIVVLGPPIGTDTTGQAPEGPLCV